MEQEEAEEEEETEEDEAKDDKEKEQEKTQKQEKQSWEPNTSVENTYLLRFCICHRAGAQHNRQQAEDALRQDNDHAGPVIKMPITRMKVRPNIDAAHQEGKYGEATRRDD